MLSVVTCMLVFAILSAAAYYVSYQWVNLRHNRDTIADELKRAIEHIEDLESRIAMMEAEKSLQEYKIKPSEDNTGWAAMEFRS